MRYISAAFTGYRTEKLQSAFPSLSVSELKNRIELTVREQAKLGIKYFLCGMCRGSDLLCAEAVLSLRVELGLELWCVIPYPEHRSTVPQNETELYDSVLKNANGVIVLGKDDPKGKDRARLYNERNRYMLSHSDCVIAVCKEDNILPGGTKNTVDMAKKEGKKVIFLL